MNEEEKAYAKKARRERERFLSDMEYKYNQGGIDLVGFNLKEYLDFCLSKFGKLERKYNSLVWLARKQPEHYENPKILKLIEEVKEQYPEEVSELSSESEGDWSHGFNSGCLASMRYALECFNAFGAVNQADEEFPFLDT